MSEAIDCETYDLSKYLEADAVGRLTLLSAAWAKSKSESQRQFFSGQMIGITIDLDEHPAWFKHNCLCATCRSYA